MECIVKKNLYWFSVCPNGNFLVFILITRLIVIDIASLTVLSCNCLLFCNCPLLKDMIFNDFNGTRTHNHLVPKRTLNHLAKLAK